MKNSIKITAILIMILVFNACNPNKDITGIWKYKDNADEDIYYSFIFFNDDGSFKDMMLYNGYQNDVTGTYELDTVKDILIMKAIEKTLVTDITFSSSSITLHDKETKVSYSYEKSSEEEYQNYLQQSQEGRGFED